MFTSKQFYTIGTGMIRIWISIRIIFLIEVNFTVQYNAKIKQNHSKMKTNKYVLHDIICLKNE